MLGFLRRKAAVEPKMAVTMDAVSEIGPFSDEPLKQQLRAGRFALNSSMILMTGTICGVVAMFSYMVAYRNDILHREVGVYFDIKAIDHDGHPVSGAKVYTAAKTLGTTDSFGEWRTFMRLPQRTAITISMEKNLQGERLLVHKNFVIPRVTHDDEVNIQQTIALVSESRPSTKEVVQEKVEVPTASEVEHSAKEESSAVDTSGFAVDVISEHRDVVPAFMQAVASHLQQILQHDGQKLNTHAAIRLQLRPLKASKDLFEFRIDGVAKKSYLRNIVADTKLMAKQLFLMITNSEAPKHWQRFEIGLSQALAPGAHLYALGREATKLSATRYQYYAPAKAQVNLTVVSNGIVSLRKRVPVGSALLSLPSSRFSGLSQIKKSCDPKTNCASL
jgi:hypothetical protein